MPIRRHYLEVLAVVALPVIALDLATKQAAVTLLTGREIPLTSFVRLVLVHNHASALGVWLGAHTWGLNVGFTLATVLIAALVCRGLAAVDRASPVALGLIVGAALGNLVSLLVPPAGVPDFISVGAASGRQLIFNLADVAAYVGVMMCLRTAVLLARAVRLERQPRPATARATLAERQIAIPVVAERGLADVAYHEPAYREAPHREAPRREAAYGEGAPLPLVADGVLPARLAAMERPERQRDARP